MKKLRSFRIGLYLLLHSTCYPQYIYAQNSDDTQRTTEVFRALTALESYALENDTYAVSDSGYDDRGLGWFHFSGGVYANSIAETLHSQGFLDAPLPKDPLHLSIDSYSPYDFLIYQCLDRVAVFSKTDNLLPDPEHQSWWDENNCTQYPITTLNHPFFILSNPLPIQESDDTQRTTEVFRALTALQSYALENDTYAVSDSGYDDRGLGWFHFSGGVYANSIAETLHSQGFLDAPLPKDPLHLSIDSYSPYDFLIYQCLDRVAVFSKTDNLLPDPEHQSWWDENNCTQYPITTLNHPFFILSNPLFKEPSSPELLSYTLVFEDNFSTSSISPVKWNTSLLWGPYLPINNEEQLYVDTLGMHDDFHHSPFTFTGDSLIISATPTSESLQPPPRPPESHSDWQPNSYSEYRYNGPYTDPNTGTEYPGYQPSDLNYLSGIITSYGSFNMTHGYAEARIKMSGGRGLWPAFWMLPMHYVKDVPEIDIMEFLGQDTDTLYNTYHYFDIANNWQKISTPSFVVSNPDWTLDFHTYGVEWSPRKIAWYVDGVKTHEITDSEYDIAGQAMYLIANIAVGGNWPGAPDASTPFPATMEIDYIRAYKRKLAPTLDLAADYQIMFNDEFDSASLDPEKWNTHFLWGPYLPINHEEQYYVDALGSDAAGIKTPFVLNNGILSITARSGDDPNSFPIPQTLPTGESGTANASIWQDFPTFSQNANYQPGNYTSGIITSYDAFKFANGYAEIRANIPKGDGLWPAFWLLNGYYVSQQPEIDIMEVRGENPHQIVHSFHRQIGGVSQSTSYTTTNGSPDLGYSDDFHTYGVQWQPGKITWYIDGSEVQSYSGDDVGYQVMYVLANLAVGGDFNYSDVDPSLFPTSLDIDYIRVYQEKDPN